MNALIFEKPPHLRTRSAPRKCILLDEFALEDPYTETKCSYEFRSEPNISLLMTT